MGAPRSSRDFENPALSNDAGFILFSVSISGFP